MKSYSDRPWYQYHFSKATYYKYQAEEYEQNASANRAISYHRLKLLEKLGYEYSVAQDMYIKVGTGEALWL